MLLPSWQTKTVLSVWHTDIVLSVLGDHTTGIQTVYKGIQSDTEDTYSFLGFTFKLNIKTTTFNKKTVFQQLKLEWVKLLRSRLGWDGYWWRYIWPLCNMIHGVNKTQDGNMSSYNYIIKSCICNNLHCNSWKSSVWNQSPAIIEGLYHTTICKGVGNVKQQEYGKVWLPVSKSNLIQHSIIKTIEGSIVVFGKVSSVDDHYSMLLLPVLMT